MSDQPKYFPVNWIDGMKINKDHFIAQDNATIDALHRSISLNLSSIRYGLRQPSIGGDDTFRVIITADNQNSISVNVLNCKAVTPGGMLINIPTLPYQDENGTVTATFPVTSTDSSLFYIVLTVHPFDRLPAGSPDLNENPPRFPYTQPNYKIEIADEARYRQLGFNPYALTIGRFSTDGSSIRVDEEYIPPSISVNAHTDLLQLHAELDQFFAGLEIYCSQIVQKIFKKNQQNELNDVTRYLCERMMLYLGETITAMRRTILYQPPVTLFASVSGLARTMKNTIDLRIGSGKDQLINYFSHWSGMSQGELDILMSTVANLAYNHNNINESILPVVKFVKLMTSLFETLSNLEFIGKLKEGVSIFIKEEPKQTANDTPPVKAKRKFTM
jgi:hypothetical protein